jgi:hypothetical protein
MSHSIDKGSQIAKDGFKNEDEVVEKFNNWQTDLESQQWLETMGYDLKEIEFVEAFKLSGYKTDVQVQGGDGGRITANMLQFKINPAELFNI